MWYCKEQNEQGEHVDAQGVRYTLVECYRVIAPDGRRNAELGYTEFSNMDECCVAWGLKYEPMSDELFTAKLADN